MSSKKQEEEKKRGLDKRTPAQVAYEKMQEKRVRLKTPPVTPRVQPLRGLRVPGVTGPCVSPAANGADPEESVENPQAASGGEQNHP